MTLPPQGGPESPPVALPLAVERVAWDTHEVAILPHHLCHAPDDNREVGLDSVQDLLASMSAQGQLVPCIAYPHPTLDGHWMLADGARRGLAARVLNVGVKALLLARRPSPAELLRLRLACNGNRKGPDNAELGADLWALQQETGCSQQELCAVCNKGPAQVSKLLAPFKDGVPELQAAVRERKIPLTAAPAIAALPPDQQVAVLPACMGQKRSTIEHLVRQVKGKKPQGKKLKVTHGGFTLTARNPTVEGVQKFLADLADALKCLGRQSWGLDMLPHVLGGKP